MKTLKIFLTLLFLTSVTTCKKWEGVPIEFHDPQEILSLAGVLPLELINAFGEEHIHFGPMPPDLNGISFKVEGMTYDTCIRYIFGPGGEIMISPTAPPTHEGTHYYHHFWNYVEQLSQHKLKTVDPSGNIFVRTNDTIYIIGHDSVFSAYYRETILEPQSGQPTNYIIFSGTVLRDKKTNQFIGIKDYRLGKMIKSYAYQPEIPSYAPGTIEVKKHEGIAYPYDWDTRTQRHHP